MARVGTTRKDDGSKSTSYTKSFREEVDCLIGSMAHAWDEGFYSVWVKYRKSCVIPRHVTDKMNSDLMRELNQFYFNDVDLTDLIAMMKENGQQYAQYMADKGMIE